ncbi:hypothetical protein GOBAR_AA21275 [Gossypium barbadense]|uniref:C2H2-type domain-containing protein n=1 Tax=Gossypium barbadense TaxID=3634 RepID=A0A2P5X7V0_GOSBA|nr:hypothetical protein GOBAR_AA21275 [Gossypium barbadense]
MLPDSSCSSQPLYLENGSTNNKRKRRPAGTPDPDAEVVSLSPKTLLESDRYVCEICNQGFQRDQNLQMHRRRHKVPWKLLKRETPVVRKRVFVCPEPTCLHHDPCHALGDLVGIKKHFRRKHSNHKQWVCQKCSKGYAVQSDYKAHLKTCGTRGHSCDCGRVFSRQQLNTFPEDEFQFVLVVLLLLVSNPIKQVESFIEHQDACHMGRVGQEPQALQPACLSRTASSHSPSSDTNFSTSPWPSSLMFAKTMDTPSSPHKAQFHNLELQLLTTSSPSPTEAKKYSTQAGEQIRVAMAEKAYAEEARREAKRQMEIAEQEFGKAKRIRLQAQAELEKAHDIKEHAIKQIKSTMLEITCQACKQQFQARTVLGDKSPVVNYISSGITEGEVENDIGTKVTKT